MNIWGLMVILLTLAALVGWVTYRAVKEEKPKKRRKAIIVYSCIYITAIGLFLFFYVAPPGKAYMENLFYYMGGTISYR